MKRKSDLASDIIPETAQLVSPAQKTAAPYLPPTLLNYFHSGGHSDNDSLRQQLPATNEQDSTMNASSRQDTPSTLSQWSSQRKEIPSDSKFTLGLSPSNFPSLLFPQQVVFGKHRNPRTSFDKQNRPVTSIHSSRSSSDKLNYSDLAASSKYQLNDSNTSTSSTISSCSFEDISASRFRYFCCGAKNPTPSPKGKLYNKPLFPQPTPPYLKRRQYTVNPQHLHRYKQRPQLKVAHPYVKHHQDKQTAIPTRAKPEASYLSEFYSPNRDPISREDESLSSPESSPTTIYSIADTSENVSPGSASEEEGPTSPYRGAGGGIKPPCFKLSSEFSDEPDRPLRAQTITNKEFYHFINGKAMAFVMFYSGRKTSKDALQVWNTEAKEQVIYQKHKNPQTSSRSLKYSNARRDNFDTRIRSSPSAYDRPEYAYTSTRSSTSSHDESEDLDTSIRSSTSSYDEYEDLDKFGESVTCDDEKHAKFGKRWNSRNIQRDLFADALEFSSSHWIARGGIKPPCFKLNTQLNDEPPTFTSAKTITGNEFYHFISEKNMAAVMFYMGHKTSKETLKVWDREAREKNTSGDRNYGFVDCDTETALCAREHVSKNPFYKIFFGGNMVASGPHYKLLTQPAKPNQKCPANCRRK